MSSVDNVVSYFKEGLNCAQALVSTYGPQLGLSEDAARKISAPFGAGMGCMAEVCGAVTGALMVIGLKAGNTETSDKKKKRETMGLTKDFCQQFRSRNESIICRDLLDCDISTPEGMKVAQKEKLFTTECPKFVRDAAEIIEDILEI